MEVKESEPQDTKRNIMPPKKKGFKPPKNLFAQNEKKDLLKDAEDAFYGGGTSSQPKPTPTPKPKSRPA